MRLSAYFLVVALLCTSGCGACASSGSTPSADAAPAGDAASSDVLQGVPPDARDPLVLYERALSRPRAMGVDDTHIYWAEANRDGLGVMKARKDGSGEIAQIGTWSGYDLSLKLFAIDQTHVYWLEDAQINKYSKADGSVTSIALGTGHGGGALVLDDLRLYVADLWCRAIGRVEKDGSNVTFEKISDAAEMGGGTGIAVDETDVFCGRGKYVFMQPKLGGAVTVLAANQDWVSSVASDGVNAYWANNRPNSGTASGTENLAMVPKAGGASVDLGRTGGEVASLRPDVPRRAIYFVQYGGPYIPVSVIEFSLDERAFRTIASNQRSNGGVADDRDYFYWVTETAIMRVGK